MLQFILVEHSYILENIARYPECTKQILLRATESKRYDYFDVATEEELVETS